MRSWIDRIFTPSIAYSSNTKGNFIWNYLCDKQFRKFLKRGKGRYFVTSMAPSWWYKLFSGWIRMPDSYGVAALKNTVLNH
ncbi:hypothetical protein ACFSN5_08695 [Streptococcus tangpeifui]|uniref:hypothetical protein n=1 Tax=Streptococcus tangpeifui TaxID=2709400 RepID=UPI0037DA3D8E